MYKTALLLLIAFLSSTAAGLWYLNTPPQNLQDDVYFTIQDGEPFSAVARRLRMAGLVRSAYFIQFFARIDRRDILIQSGSYMIPSNMTAHQLIEFLTTGRQLLVKVSIPEGLTIRKVGRILEQAGIASAEEFIAFASDPAVAMQYNIEANTLEGYLFPDTYHFARDYSVEAVVAHMIAGFHTNLRNQFPDLENADRNELHRVITLASMIEKEYLEEDDAPIISSVFHNRLARGQRLEACSTIVYLITEVEGKEHPSRLYFADLERDSLYNTYRNNGLPPGPIANPGNIAIDAALNPADTNFFYFVLESEDATRHKFSQTFSEHNEARIIYLRGRN